MEAHVNSIHCLKYLNLSTFFTSFKIALKRSLIRVNFQMRFQKRFLIKFRITMWTRNVFFYQFMEILLVSFFMLIGEKRLGADLTQMIFYIEMRVKMNQNTRFSSIFFVTMVTIKFHFSNVDLEVDLNLRSL